MIQAINDAFFSTFIQVLFLFGPGLVLTMAMSKISAIFAHQVCRAIGVRGYLLTFGWLGTAVHELSHAFTALIFGHKIDEIKLFQIKPESNRLGYIRHKYDKNSVYQRIGNLLIGIAPILMGSIIIFLSAKFLVPDVAAVISEGRTISGDDGWLSVYFGSFFLMFWELIDFGNFFKFKFYLFLYILFCVGSAMTLSPADLKGAKSGFFVFVGVMLIINFYREILYSFSYPNEIIKFIFFIYNLMAGVLLLQLVLILLFRIFIKRKNVQ